jgi:hypothetical protein
LQSINGLATGAAQTLMGNLGGLYGGAGQVGTVLFAGNALASLAPPIIQAAFILSTGETSVPTPADTRAAQRYSAQAVFSFGALGTLGGIYAINALARTENYRRLTASRAVMEANEDYMTVGSRADIRQERWAVSQVRIADVFIVLVRALWLFLLAAAPYVKSTVRGSTDMFWATNLSTLLIVSAAFGDFGGRLIANKRAWIITSLRTLVAGQALPLTCVAVTVAYISTPSLQASAGSGNLLMLSLYFVMPLLHGYSVVCLSSSAQTACGFYPGEDSCPIVSQFSWLSSQTGLVLGIVLSFLPMFPTT